MVTYWKFTFKVDANVGNAPKDSIVGWELGEDTFSFSTSNGKWGPTKRASVNSFSADGDHVIFDFRIEKLGVFGRGAGSYLW